ncbi:MAG: NADH-quinone oxidoreductase subunit A [Bacteroidota bacterium]
MQNTELSGFGTVLLFIVGAISLVLVTLVVIRLIRPNRLKSERLSVYKLSEDSLGSAEEQFNSRFYVIVLMVILFDVEIAFLFPWATVMGQAELIEQTGGAWGWFALVGMSIFMLILGLGLIYVRAKGFLNWGKPQAYSEEKKQ